ncbi:hypothetical protein [Nocardioides stalactiti]|uniref:hypothetical protein n=1 Tax=Nocardioides stalactiti TaxID=2755356 RepID=UPI0016030324|nr:hypothetical protein [Nocardioides stalactiti]
MGHPRLAAAAVVALLTVTGAVVTAPAAADTTPVPGTLSSGVGATVALDVPVPAGLEPTRIDAQLSIESPDARDLAEVRITAGGRVAATVPARPGPVSFRVRRADVDNGVIALEMTLLAEEGATQDGRCGDFPQGLATLEEIELETEGREKAPDTIADFLPSTVREVAVAVDPLASEDLLGAALSTIAAVSSRYPAGVEVTLVPDGGPVRRPAPGDRRIRLVEGSGAVATEISRSGGVPTLTISGPAEDLSSAAAALTSPALGLADGAETTGLGATAPARAVVDTLSFTDLGAPFAHLAGYGRVEQFVRVQQDAFGGPLDGLHVSVRGTHSAVPDDVEARFDTYVNGTLLDSVALDGSDDLSIDVEVPTSLLRADNSVVLVLESTPPNGGCDAVNPAPVEVHLDSAASSVTATHGDGPGGFVAYPQAFSGHLPVVLGGAADHFEAAQDGAALVAALQREATRPLTVGIETLDAVLEDEPGAALVLYPTADETDDLGLPLDLGAEREFGTDAFTVDVSSSYAALQASRTDAGARVLTLASWNDASDQSPGASSARLVRSVAKDGWTALSGGDVLVATPRSTPTSYNSGVVGYPPEPPASATDEGDAAGPGTGVPDDSDDEDTTLTRQLVGGGIGLAFIIGLFLMIAKVASNRRRDAA